MTVYYHVDDIRQSLQSLLDAGSQILQEIKDVGGGRGTMNEQAKRIQKPRCFLVYALAPEDLPAVEANRIFNDFIGDRDLPLGIYHDHFIGQPGGVALFYVDTPEARDALLNQKHLEGWQVDFQPLVFSYSPAAFDEQTAFTLKAYRDLDWEELQKEERPSYGNPRREAETATEE